MLELEDRVDWLCSCAAGCGFLLTMEDAGLDPEFAARPDVCIEMAAIALREVNPFHPNHDWTVATVLAERTRLRDLARSILSQENASWIFERLERSAQLWISDDPAPPSTARLTTPTNPLSEWERYAQKPWPYFFTSTSIGGTSSRLAAIANGVGDFNEQPRFTQYRMEVDPNARVYEVASHRAWHRLCEIYPAKGEDGQLVPNWPHVAHDWDAVHLSLGGLLTAEQVRVESAVGWSRHWAWDAEQTLWLRWCFVSAKHLPDITVFPEPAVSLTWPRWISERKIEHMKRGRTSSVASVILESESDLSNKPDG